VALLPRSAELQPLILRFVFTSPSCSPNCPGCLHFQWSPPLEMDGFQMRGKLSRVSTFSEAGGHPGMPLVLATSLDLSAAYFTFTYL